jgi:hypothetical protein
MAEVVPMDPGNAALNYPIAQQIQPAQQVQPAQVAQVAQPSPVSMFDLVPGRRYIISNREEGFGEVQETFNATFICLTYVKSDHLRFRGPTAHLNLFEDLNGVEHRRRLEATREHHQSNRHMVRHISGQLHHIVSIFPIFSYEQGLTQHQLEDLTLDLDIMSLSKRVEDSHRNITGPHPLSSRQLTWGRPITPPLPGLTYYGHDEHSGYGGGRGRRIQYSNFIDRNFRYQLFKYFIDQNTKVRGSSHNRLPHWYDQGARSAAQRTAHEAIAAAGDEGFSDVYFNNHLELLLDPTPIVQHQGQPARLWSHFLNYSGRDFFPPAGVGGDSPGQRLGLPPLTPLQDYILKHTRPMIVLPRYWSFTYGPQDDLLPGFGAFGPRVGELVGPGQNPRPRRERAARRSLDGGKRTTKKRRGKKTRRLGERKARKKTRKK